jgi:DNA repair protein RadC
MTNDIDNNPVRRPATVREMAEDDRPRERLEQCGAEALKDAELMAVLFRTGTRETNAVALAELLLVHFDHSLRRISQASLEELQQVKGIGRVKAIEIKAALELGKRLEAHKRPAVERIRSSEDVVRLLMHKFKEYETEHFKTLLLNTKNEVLKTIEVSHGGIDGTEAMPRDVLRQAVRESAAAIIVAHNHPSGDPEPSRADIALTKRLSEAAQIVGISLLDHVVFGDGRHVSLKERGLM